jgi:hypothetical protein
VRPSGPALNDAFGTLPRFAAKGTDVLEVLDSQSRAVTGLFRDTGLVFEALTRNEGQLRNLVVNTDRVFSATASRRESLAETFRIFPTFLDESRLTVEDLRTFARQARPVLRDLRPGLRERAAGAPRRRAFAPDLERLYRNLDPLIDASRTGLPALSETLRGLVPVLGQGAAVPRGAQPDPRVPRGQPAPGRRLPPERRRRPRRQDVRPPATRTARPLPRPVRRDRRGVVRDPAQPAVVRARQRLPRADRHHQRDPRRASEMIFPNFDCRNTKTGAPSRRSRRRPVLLRGREPAGHERALPARRQGRLREGSLMPHLLRTRTAVQEASASCSCRSSSASSPGFFLGEQELVYLVLSLLGILGGFVAGLEHETPAEGAYRGLLGGLLFGASIIITHQVRDVPAVAQLAEPESLLIVVTAAFGAGLGALGGRLRGRRLRARARRRPGGVGAGAPGQATRALAPAAGGRSGPDQVEHRRGDALVPADLEAGRVRPGPEGGDPAFLAAAHVRVGVGRGPRSSIARCPRATDIVYVRSPTTSWHVPLRAPGGTACPVEARKTAPMSTASSVRRAAPRPAEPHVARARDDRQHLAGALGQLVVDARRHLAVALAGQQPVGDHAVQARAELLGGDAGQDALQLDEPPRAAGEVADDEQRPLVPDEVQGTRVGRPLVVRMAFGGRDRRHDSTLHVHNDARGRSLDS